jgi:hypothetical protein
MALRGRTAYSKSMEAIVVISEQPMLNIRTNLHGCSEPCEEIAIIDIPLHALDSTELNPAKQCRFSAAELAGWLN